MPDQTAARSPFVVSPEWLEARLDGSVRILDASWYLPAQNRDPRAEYHHAHIPGAVFFDQDEVVEPEAALPHTLPSPAVFARHAGALGLSETDTIVVYDGPGMFTAPRVWWMLRTMGAESVFVLDGGFDGWKRDGRPVTAEVPAPAPAVFSPRFAADAYVDLHAMRAIVEDGSRQIADARSAGRFEGAEAEPRAGVRGGHMPGAVNVPVMTLSEGGRLKDLDGLRRTLTEAGLDLDRPVATTCGSGITAAVIALALSSLGHPDVRLYDGSWTEWGSRDDTPVETGPARPVRKA